VRKVMHPVEVSVDKDGMVVITQPDPMHENGGEIVMLTPEQVPAIAKWLLEAAGAQAFTGEGGRKVEELRTMAHLFSRLDEQMPCDESHVTEMVQASALSVALRWAAGDSDESPEDWYFEQRRERRN